MKLKSFALKQSRIEMVPLIDSFFLILVYFIYAFLSMSRHQGIPLQLPEARSAVEEKITHHGISIAEDGSLFWDRVPVTAAALAEKLRYAKSAEEDGKLSIFIYGDASAAHGRVIQVMDLVRSAGIHRIFMETERRAGREEGL